MALLPASMQPPIMTCSFRTFVMLSSCLNSFAWLGSLPVPSKLNTSVFIAVLPRDQGPRARSRLPRTVPRPPASEQLRRQRRQERREGRDDDLGLLRRA